VIQPTSADLDVMGGNALDNAAAPPVARAAHRSVTALLARDVVAERVAILATPDDRRPVDATG
jgi:hypothetical protein